MSTVTPPGESPQRCTLVAGAEGEKEEEEEEEEEPPTAAPFPPF